MIIKHILVPYDDSDYSIRAFEAALDLAKKYRARISLITIMYSSVLGSSFLDLSPHQTIIEKSRLEKLEKVFKHYESVAKKSRTPFIGGIKMSASVSESILSYASHQKADLIVMGTRGRGGSPPYMRLGSVAIEVSQASPCPVFLVK